MHSCSPLLHRAFTTGLDWQAFIANFTHVECTHKLFRIPFLSYLIAFWKIPKYCSFARLGLARLLGHFWSFSNSVHRLKKKFLWFFFSKTNNKWLMGPFSICFSEICGQRIQQRTSKNTFENRTFSQLDVERKPLWVETDWFASHSLFPAGFVQWMVGLPVLWPPFRFGLFTGLRRQCSFQLPFHQSNSRADLWVARYDQYPCDCCG